MSQERFHRQSFEEISTGWVYPMDGPWASILGIPQEARNAGPEATPGNIGPEFTL